MSTEPDPTIEHGISVIGKWQWTNAGGAMKWTRPQQGIRTPRVPVDIQPLYDVRRSRLKIRGRGESLAVRFESEPGKDFIILGWAVKWVGETED